MKRSTLGNSVAAVVFALGLGHAVANPTGGQVASGSATITTVPGTVTINQASNIAIINWQSFSISAGELTKFVQPSASSAALNRVLGGQTSIINGTLSANGQVYLINGNGIVVGPGGTVNANSFVASTRDISDSDFLNGNYHFTGSSPNGVQNLGTINAAGGDVYLIGKTVDNQGSINAANGTVGLAAADDVLLNLSGEEHVFVSASPTATSASTQTAVHNSGTIAATSAELKAANGNLYALAINNEGTIRATTTATKGGHIYLTTDAGLVQNNGTLSAKKSKNGGTVKITGGSVWNRKTIDASGEAGGQVTINSQNIQNDGSISVRGTKYGGGAVDFIYSNNALGSINGLIDASGFTQGGSIDITGTGANSEAYLSLTFNVGARFGTAGSINIATPTLYLTGATLEANGYSGGGDIFLGTGNPATSSAASQIAYVSTGTSIQANATHSGDGGNVDVTGTVQTQFGGTASAKGAGSGDDGSVVITGPATIGGASVQLNRVTNSATRLTTISTTSPSTTGPATPGFEFVDPDPSANDAFGRPTTGLFNLSSNRTLITAPGDNFGGAGAGAVYLFSNSNGALLSTLRGNHAGDGIGTTVDLLTGGNFAVLDSGWNSNTGAVTFGNGSTGFAAGGGFVSNKNSLLGSASGDEIGSGGLFTLFNGNVLVISPHFDGDAGAVTFAKPSAGIVGTVSSANSLVGANGGDQIGSGGIVQLSNGANYLVLSPDFNGGAGAVSSGSDATGSIGTVSSTNSLVGASSGDGVGSGGSIFDTGFGYYLVTTLGFNGGAGAVTWSSDSNSTVGTVSSTNSLVGSSSGDNIGNGGITLLADNRNYVVTSSDWNNGAGAVTLGNGAGGISGVVSASNSLVGAASGDHAGSGGITVLFGNGRYVVSSPDWNGGAGAVTLASSSSGATGVIGSSNSLVGAHSGDSIGSGGITLLDNGNIVVLSPDFNNDAGAVTWEDVTSGKTGVVSSSNSLVGANSGDAIGSGGIFQLSNGNNFLVLSPSFNGGAGAITNGDGSIGLTGVVGSSNSLVGASSGDHVGAAGSVLDSFNNYYLVTTANFNNGSGAITWNNDAGGTTGVISSSNSLVGASGDHLGSNGVTFLFDGNYLVNSPDWNSNTGAVTWGSSSGGVSGTVSSSNSLVGAASGDKVGSDGIIQLSSGGNYLVLSSNWNGGAGAVTNGNSSSGISGVVSGSNSLVGGSSTDGVGAAGSVIDPFDGYYLVKTANWNGGAGAVTWNNDTTGTTGLISNSNSLVGSTPNDHVGSGGITILFNGNYVIDSPDWNNDAGAVTFCRSTGRSGFIGESNSVVGDSVSDGVGSGGILTLNNNNYLILSPDFGGGAGAVTWGDGTNGTHGFVSSSNSLVGGSNSDAIGSGGVQILTNGNYVVLSPDWNGGAGAVTWGSSASGVSGIVSNSNSLVGASSSDAIGSGGIVQLSNGNDYLVLSPNFNGGAGAVTQASSSSAITGTVSASDSLVGASSSDGVGSAGSIFDSGDGYYLVTTANWGGGAGAVTWGNDNNGATGVVGSSNSLVGASSSDHVGSGGITELANGNYLVLSPNWNDNAGAVTFGTHSGGVSGVVGSGNSLVGSDSSDHLGSGGIVQLSNGNFVVLSPLFDGSAGAATWGSETSGVKGVVSASNSITGGTSDAGMQYAGQSADGSIYLISFTTDTSEGGDGRVLAGSVNGPTSTPALVTVDDFFTDPSVISVEASGFGFTTTSSSFAVTDPASMTKDSVKVGDTGGAINSGNGKNLASGSSTSNAPGPHRLVTPGNGVWNIFNGVVHSAPPPANVSFQLKLNLNPQVLAHLHEILFGN